MGVNAVGSDISTSEGKYMLRVWPHNDFGSEDFPTRCQTEYEPYKQTLTTVTLVTFIRIRAHLLYNDSDHSDLNLI